MKLELKSQQAFLKMKPKVHMEKQKSFFFFFLCGENQSIEWMCKIKIFLTVEIKADSVDKMIEK